MKVRGKAVEWLSNLSNDDIYDFLPQLVQVRTYVCTYICMYIIYVLTVYMM